MMESRISDNSASPPRGVRVHAEIAGSPDDAKHGPRSACARERLPFHTTLSRILPSPRAEPLPQYMCTSSPGSAPEVPSITFRRLVDELGHRTARFFVDVG